MRTALITGANRGLGLATAEALAEQGYHVILGIRDMSKGIALAAEFEERGWHASPCQLEVTNQESIVSAYEAIKKRWGRLDVLVNNAGVLLDFEEYTQHPSGLFTTNREMLFKTLEVNTVAPYQLCEAFLSLMVSHHFGRIVNVTSGLGQLHQMEAGYPAYRLSKTALNAVTRIFSSLGKGKNVLVNSVDPGWVKTDMGGSSAPRSLKEGIDTIVWAATLPDGGPTGQFFLDRHSVEW